MNLLAETLHRCAGTIHNTVIHYSEVEQSERESLK